ncbi:hypothetical protein OK348_16565 [Flavobacterium sp. MXW15]|uniref:TOBE domain-containing protein n=1 Tax=Xanthomonas chitinilytica TaxID=2989819 RepID=A0ABT3K047_9XANT|nr:hypothetical protein [Xanthomonas sp. H13-6]MCW4456395.1 hypothetical protein [Flavobacterium sp. MXW15]MCW4474100.1 hypothetical protein [Xanthomonas sp. H13-6]
MPPRTACFAAGAWRRAALPGAGRGARLRIHVTVDGEVFAAITADSQRLHPGSEVMCEDVITPDLHAR